MAESSPLWGGFRTIPLKLTPKGDDMGWHGIHGREGLTRRDRRKIADIGKHPNIPRRRGDAAENSPYGVSPGIELHKVALESRIEWQGEGVFFFFFLLFLTGGGMA